MWHCLQVDFNTWNMPHGAACTRYTGRTKFHSWNSHDHRYHWTSLSRARDGTGRKKRLGRNDQKRKIMPDPKSKTPHSLWYTLECLISVGRNFCGYLILRYFPNRQNSQNIVPANNSNNKVGKKYISVDRHYNAIWTKNNRRSWLLRSCENVEAMLHFLLDNVFIQVGGKVFQQCVGIPMGTNCAPLLAELILHDYESSAMIRFSRTNGHPQAKSFEFTRRYI